MVYATDEVRKITDTVLRDARIMAVRYRLAESRAQTAMDKRDAAIFEAQKAGAAYRDIAFHTGLTIDRIKQVLQEQRRSNERGLPDESASGTS